MHQHLTRLRRWALRRLRGRCGVVYDGTFPKHHGAVCERYKGHPSLHADNPHTISWSGCGAQVMFDVGPLIILGCERSHGHAGMHARWMEGYTWTLSWVC